MKYFLGSGAGYRGTTWRRTFLRGRERDYTELARLLAKRYGFQGRDRGQESAPKSSDVVLCKNGRSALCLALKTLLEPGSGVIVNGFTCYAVVEAILTAGMVPVYADISLSDLNFNVETLEDALLRTGPAVAGIIVQNTLGDPVDMKAIEKFAKKNGLVIIEDLAHSAGVKYKDGREAGTVGAATVLSFGKEKMIDCVSGGAVVFRGGAKADEIKATEVGKLAPKVSDYLRERFYPLITGVARGLAYVHLNGVWMRLMLKMHWVERSADNRLDLERRMPKFEARLAVEQIGSLRRVGEKPVREFFLVENRDEVLAALKKAGYFFDGFWYEKPVSPARYYKKVHFSEADCPNAVTASEHIINFPRYYRKSELRRAYEIVERVGRPLAEEETEKRKAPTEGLTEVKEARNKVPITERGAK